MAFSSKDKKYTELSGKRKRENDTPRKFKTPAIQDAEIEGPSYEEDSSSDSDSDGGPYRPGRLLQQIEERLRKIDSSDEDLRSYLEFVDESFYQDQFEQAMQHGSESVYDLRLMMVGHQGVGKTTITKGLLNDETPREQIISTDGIDVYIGWGQIDIETGAWETGGRVANDTYIKLARVLKEMHIKHSAKKTVKSQARKKDSRHETEADKTLELMAKDLDVKHFYDKAKEHRGHKSNTAPVQIWDFGGQVVFYTTHQTFLSVRCVYLLVFDLSKSLNEHIDDIHFVPGEVEKLETLDFLFFWVNSILSYTGGIYPGLPKIFFVGTHLDLIPVEDRDNKVSKVFDDIRSHFGNHPGFDHLVINPALCLNAKNHDDIGYHELRSAIFKIATTQPFWGEKRPTSWIVLEEMIKKLKINGTEYLTLTQINVLNNANQIHVMSDEELETFLRFQHFQGNILFFAEKSLRDFVILNPSWLIDALKSFFTAEIFCGDDHAKREMWMNATKKGILEEEAIYKVWQKEENKEYLNNKEHVLKAMERLDLISRPKMYSADGEDVFRDFYFVPSMISNISSEEINDVIPAERSFCMALRPKQNFLPPAIFHRLTASCLSMWPLLQVKNEGLLYSGLCGLRLDNFHRLFLQQRHHQILINICHTRDVKAVSQTLCRRLKEFFMHTLNRITDVYDQHQSSEKTERFEITIPSCSHLQCLLTRAEKPCLHHERISNQILLSEFQEIRESGKIESMKSCLSSCKGLDEKIMEKQPTDQDLCRLSRHLTSPPDMLGTALGFSEAMRCNIISSCSYFWNQERNFYLLVHWRDRQDRSKATFDSLKDILKDTDDKDNDHIFCQIHKADATSVTDDITKHIFTKKPSIQHLDLLTDRLEASVAFFLGIELGFTLAQIEDIRRDFPSNSWQQKREMLYKWRNMTNIKATYILLCEALQQIGYSYLLKEILTQQSNDDEI